MADGLPGHEYDFYHFVRDSPWLGGHAEYSSLNEAFSYWFNGLVPLAYALGDLRLKSQACKAADYVLSHQQSDGWLGPETELRKRNFWARYPLFLGLAQLVDVDPYSKRATAAVQAMHGFVDLMHSMLSDNYQGYVRHDGDDFEEQWGRARAADMVLALQWLYEQHPMQNQTKIWECMTLLYEQAYDWSDWFGRDYIRSDIDSLPTDVANAMYPFLHVVNAGQGLKSSAVFRRLIGTNDLLKSSRLGVDLLYRYHGTPSGSIVGDERLAGINPTRGTELCAVVETMFSLSYLYQAIGENDFADKCERAAFNALPVMVTADWWAHQYVAQTNQPISHELSQPPFYNVGKLGQTFGLEPNYPCCTANHHQGYPKFLSSSYMRYGEHGLAHVLLGPSEVTTTTRSGAGVEIRCETQYPFDHNLTYIIKSDRDFVFFIRVPSWALRDKTSVAVNDKTSVMVDPDAQTGMHAINVVAGNTHLTYNLAAEVRIEQRASKTVTIYHGALQYAVAVNGIYTSKPPQQRYEEGSSAPEESRDWTILPNSTWSYAIDPSTLRFVSEKTEGKELPDPIFAEKAPPVGILVLACEIAWNLTGGYVSTPPPEERRQCFGKPYDIFLRPYGAAKLHIAELPTLDLLNDGGSASA